MGPLFSTYINGATYVNGNWDPCIDSRKSEHTHTHLFFHSASANP